MWLRAEADDRAYYPDEAGHFNLQDASLLFGAVLSVEGPSLPPGSAPSLTVSSTAQSSGVGASASYNSTPPLHRVDDGLRGISRKRKYITVMIDSALDHGRGIDDRTVSIVRIVSKLDDMKKDVHAIMETIQQTPIPFLRTERLHVNVELHKYTVLEFSLV